MPVFDNATPTLQCCMCDPALRHVRASTLLRNNDFDAPSLMIIVLRFKWLLFFATVHHHLYLGFYIQYLSIQHVLLATAHNHLKLEARAL